jgi:hypothetical protein
VAFHNLALSLASQIIRGRLASLPYLLQTSSAGLPFLRPASLADALAGSLLFFGLVRISQRLFITGTYLLAIMVPIKHLFYFNDLQKLK